MSKIEVTIIDVFGNTEQEATLPTDVPVWRIIVELLAMMKLPNICYGFDRTIYYFVHKSSGKKIENEMTLSAVGIQDNDVLRLQHELFNNCCPNCSIKKVSSACDPVQSPKNYLKFGKGVPIAHITIKTNITICGVRESIELQSILPADVPVKKIIGRLIQMMDLPPKWGYTLSISGRNIANNQSLSEVGIKNGDMLELN